MPTPAVGRSDVEGWVQRYRAAWESNDPVVIGALFTADALYRTGPFDEPWTGRELIVEEWLGRKDEPGQTTFRSEIVALADGLAVVEGWTTYRAPPAEYANLWLIRLTDDGQCHEFTEWWVQRTS